MTKIQNPKRSRFEHLGFIFRYCLGFRYSNLGFSLIEIVVSLGVIASTLLLVAVAVSGIPATQTARNQNLAYHIAAKKLEELRNTAFASLPASGSFNDAGLSELASSSAAITVSNYQSSSIIKQITVTVTWYQNNAAKTVQLDTLISQNGLN